MSLCYFIKTNPPPQQHNLISGDIASEKHLSSPSSYISIQHATISLEVAVGWVGLSLKVPDMQSSFNMGDSYTSKHCKEPEVQNQDPYPITI